LHHGRHRYGKCPEHLITVSALLLELCRGLLFVVLVEEGSGFDRAAMCRGLHGKNRRGLELINYLGGCRMGADLRPFFGRQPPLPHFQALAVLG